MRSALDFVSRRAKISWLILIGATVVSVVLGLEHGAGALVVVVVLGIAAVKVRLVGLDFMELRHAPLPLRTAFEFYAFALWGVLSILYVVA